MGPATQAGLGALAVAVLSLQPLLAQLPSPEIATIYPPGGQAGEILVVELTGTDLDDLTGLRFTHPGITAQPVILPADEIWPEPRQDGLKFTVQIAGTVPPGLHEVRTVGRYGLSTPRFFAVSPRNELKELDVVAGNETPETATPILLDQVVNGQPTANRADYYRLPVKKGQRVLVHVWGERIDSLIDPVLLILDGTGREVMESFDEIGLDPLGDFTASADGDYVIKVADYLYNGGAAYRYRMMATTAPWLDGVFPPAGKPGARQTFTIYGRNLPGGRSTGARTVHGAPLETKEVEIQVPASGEPAPVNGLKVLQQLAVGFDWRDGTSNPIRIGLARDEVVPEDAKLDEQTVRPPCEVAGRFDQNGDLDRYRFHAKQNETYVVDVIADRMGTPVDPMLVLQKIVPPAPGDPAQKETTKFIAESDDIVMNSLFPPGGFDVRSRDSRLIFTAPQDGDYRVVLSSNMSHAGILSTYRLGIRPARPGFQLLAVADKNWQEQRNGMPGVARVNAGGTTFIRVLALREDGFTGPIELSAQGLPAGVHASPVSIWQENDEGYLVVSAVSHAQDWSGEIRISGTANIDGKAVTAPAMVGTMVWSAVDTQKNRSRSRLTGGFALDVSSEPAALALEPEETRVWEAELRKVLDLPVKLSKHADVKGPVIVTPYGLPNFNRPAPLSIPSANQGVVKINFNPDGNNRPIASEGRFVFRGDGVLGKYRFNPAAEKTWDARKKEFDAKVAQLTAAKGKADAAFNMANAARSTADRAMGGHAAARDNLAKAVADAQAKLDAAKRDVEAADAAAKAVPEAWLAVAKTAAEANLAARAALEKGVADAKAKADAAGKTASDADAALQSALGTQAGNLEALRKAAATARESLRAADTELADARNALDVHLAARAQLANAAAVEEVRFRVARRAADLAASAVKQAETTHTAKIKTLADARTKAEAALKAPESALANAAKAVTDKENAKVALEKALADARTRLDGLRKAASDADAAVTASTTAHTTNVKKLTEAKAGADRGMAGATAALDAAKQNLAANTDENAKTILIQAVTDAQAKFTAAGKSVTDAANAIRDAESAQRTELAKLTSAKARADADVKSAETTLAAATKAVADADAALVILMKTRSEAQAKFDEVKKAADDAVAAIPAQEKAHAATLASLTAARESTAKASQAAETVFSAAAKRVVDHDAGKKDGLEKAVADAETKMAPARKAVADAETKIADAETAQRPVLAKLTAAKVAADLAAAATGSVLAGANEALEENVAAGPGLAKALAGARATVESAHGTVGVDPAKLAGLTAAKSRAAAAFSTAAAALAGARQALAANDAAKPVLEEAAAEAKADAEAAQAEASRLADLLNRANQAKTQADTELRNAQNRAKEKDVKFTVFSEPVDLRILEPPVP